MALVTVVFLLTVFALCTTGSPLVAVSSVVLQRKFGALWHDILEKRCRWDLLCKRPSRHLHRLLPRKRPMRDIWGWLQWRRFKRPRPGWYHLCLVCVRMRPQICLRNYVDSICSDDGCTGNSLFIGSDVAAFGDFDFNDVTSSFECSSAW